MSPEQVTAFEQPFREAFRTQPTVESSSGAKPKKGRRASMADLLNIRTVSMEEFVARTRRYVERNGWVLLLAGLLSMALGSIRALWMRKRPGFPPTVLSIRDDAA